MRSSLIAVAALFAVSGCVIHADNKSNPPPVAEYSGDITFLWSFGNKTCLQTPEIRKVRVRLSGARGVESLQDNGYFGCNLGGIDGIKLRSFAPGDYNFTIDGLDQYEKTIYTASGNVHVNGSVQLAVALNPVDNKGKLQMFWTFAGKQCAQSGIADPTKPVTDVVITLNRDSANAVTWPCRNDGVEGVAAELEPGSYDVQIDGYVNGGSGPQLWYSAGFNVTLTPGTTRDIAIDLDVVAGGATFLPVLRNSSGQQISCAQAGVSTLWVQLTDWRGNVTDPYFDDCVKFETSGFYWPWLLAAENFDTSAKAWKGTWTARIEGWNAPSSTHTILYEGAQQVQVTAGSITQTFSVNMPRK